MVRVWCCAFVVALSAFFVGSSGCRKADAPNREARFKKDSALPREEAITWHAKDVAAKDRTRPFDGIKDAAKDRRNDNPFHMAVNEPLSTFSIDVDTASYTNVRRMLNEGALPPKDAVRVEEFINYFTYNYPAPEGEHPITVSSESSICPWNAKHLLVRVGVQGKFLDPSQIPPRNLVFLVDTSGSMNPPNRLPLLRKA